MSETDTIQLLIDKLKINIQILSKDDKKSGLRNDLVEVQEYLIGLVEKVQLEKQLFWDNYR